MKFGRGCIRGTGWPPLALAPPEIFLISPVLFLVFFAVIVIKIRCFDEAAN